MIGETISIKSGNIEKIDEMFSGLKARGYEWGTPTWFTDDPDEFPEGFTSCPHCGQDEEYIYNYASNGTDEYWSLVNCPTCDHITFSQDFLTKES